jgi:hypothetical protein
MEKKTYLFNVVDMDAGTVEVKAYSKKEAIAIAQEKFENGDYHPSDGEEFELDLEPSIYPSE